METVELLRSQGLEDRLDTIGVERIVRTEAGWHVHLFDGWLAEHVGCGETIADAAADAIQRIQERIAA
jgi:hypothetical protein